METLERSRVCRLCGKHAGIAIDIFDKRANHVKKINSVLPILVHEMDLLPKHICHPCNYKLQEFHKFYEECLKTDANLKGQLSWMRGSMERKETGVPMVQINNFMIKTEPPDYDDEETTEAIMHSTNLTNYVQNNCISYTESIVTTSGAKCSRCGCYCGKRNRTEVQIAKNEGKNRPNRHNNDTKNNGDFGSRDTIRRNLFATEIFGDKNHDTQPEVPVCNMPQKMMSDVVTAVDMLDSDVRLHNLGCRQNGAQFESRHKIPDNTGKITSRILRPRAKRAVHPNHPISGSEFSTKSKSKELNQLNNLKEGTDQKMFKPVEIKVENCEEIRRSLRPRIEAIDYSDSKRKNPMARITDTKRSKSADNNPNTKVQRQNNENFTTYDKNSAFLSSTTVAIKIESKDLMESSIYPKMELNSETFKAGISRKNAKRKSSKNGFEEFINKSITHKIKTKRNVERSKSGRLSKGKVINVRRRRDLPEYSEITAAPYLRSQRGHLRNGKMMEFNSVLEIPKKIQSIKASRGILLQSIKGENGRSSQIVFKHRDCEMCNNRFASAELYMLHDCYANKRH